MSGGALKPPPGMAPGAMAFTRMPCGPSALAGRQIAANVGFLDIGAEHLRAFGLQRLDHAAADAARGAGDEGALPLEELQSPALARLAAMRSALFALSTTKRTCLPRPHC